MNATPINAALFSTRHVGPASGQVSATSAQPAGRDRALVLGGGGSAGNAWVLGVLAGLLDAGLDVTDADLVIGTSAGSTAAVQATSTSPADLYAEILAPAPQRRPAPPGSDPARRPPAPAVNHFERTSRIFAAADGPVDLRRRLGASALEVAADSDGAWQAQWRATVAGRLPSHAWPDVAVQIVAVDAATGEPVVFDRDSGVELADAVAASCASGLPYAIGGTPYIDGGYRRSSENADLAASFARVLVLSPFGGRSRAPLEWGMHLAAQVDELRAAGSDVRTIAPDSAALDAFGEDMMDLSRRPRAARAGHEQGRTLAGELIAFWR